MSNKDYNVRRYGNTWFARYADWIERVADVAVVTCFTIVAIVIVVAILIGIALGLWAAIA